MNYLAKINWDNLTPAYKTMFQERFAEWDKEDRQSLIKDLKFLRELRKRIEENAFFEEIPSEEMVADINTMINEVLEALTA